MHKTGQLLIDVLMFVTSAPVALMTYGSISAPAGRWTGGIVAIAIVEALLAFALLVMMVVHSHLVEGFENDEVWKPTQRFREQSSE